MSCNVAFIGLGVMGYPMAGYISKGGHNVTVFNRTKTKAEKWITEHKGKMAETPAEAAKDADYVFTCVGNDNDLREVTFGEKEFLKQLKKVPFILITPQRRQQLREKFMIMQKKMDLDL